MRSILRAFIRTSLVLGFVGLWLGGSSAEAQTYYYPQSGSGGTWSGYAPSYPWSGYAPGSAWSGYAPGTPAVNGTQPGVMAPGTTAAVAPTAPTYPYTYTTTAPATTASGRNLINGVRYPVRGPSPYADGRTRSYYEYGTGRSVPLAKPWLPGAPGGR